jgi:hypothetical protein
MKLTFSTTINGLYQEVQAAANRTLMEFLRHDLKLKGTVEGCVSGSAALVQFSSTASPSAPASRSGATSRTNKSRPSRVSLETTISILFSKHF